MNDLMSIVKVKQVPQSTDARFKPDANLYGLYDANGGSPLGIVKRNFTLIQPTQVVGAVETCLSQINGLDMDKLQYNVMRDGQSHRLSIPVYEYGIKNQAGLNDITQMNLDITWGYTGRIPFRLNLFGRRLVCLNGMVSAIKGASIYFKNFTNNSDRLEFACDQFVDIIAEASKAKDLTKTYDKLIVPFAERAAVISKVMNTDAKNTARLIAGKSYDTTKISDAKAQTLLTLTKSIETEIDRSGESAWGLLNGFTHFTNHEAPNVTKNTVSDITDRTDYLINGGGADINARANKVIAELIATA